MGFELATQDAFLDELEKIAFSGKLTRQLQARAGHKVRSVIRPKKATTLLAKSQYGTIKHKLAEYTPTMGWSVGEQFPEIVSKRPKRKGDIPSREDMDMGPQKSDGRDNTLTINGPGSQSLNIGATNHPSEHP